MGFLTIIVDEMKKPVRFDESTIYIRPVPVPKHQEFLRKVTKRERFRNQWVEDRDEAKLFEMVVDYMIVGWENVKHPITGEDLPCVLEHKLRLPDTVLSELLTQAGVPNLLDQASGNREDAIKNS